MTGTPVPVLTGVQRETTNGTIQFAVSATGTLVYAAESGQSGRPPLGQPHGARDAG